MKSFLSPKDLATAIGVSESSLKRWTDEGLLAATRTAGGHRRIALADAVRFIRDHQTPVLNPGVLGFADLNDTPDPADLSADRLYAALCDDRPQVARGLILAMHLSGMSLPALFDGPIRSALHRIGELWRHSPRGIAVEHRALDTCTHALNLIRSTFPQPPSSAPIALGGTPAGDPYTLTSLMAAAILADLGYRDHNLGANVPLPALLAAVQHDRPRLVWLSASVTADPAALRKLVESLADQLVSSGASLVVGGRAAADIAVRARPNLQHVSSMAELAAYARGLLSSAALPTTRP